MNTPPPLSLDSNRIRGVLFDFFGTLTVGVHSERQTIATALGVDVESLSKLMAESFYDRAIGRYGDAHQTMSWMARTLGVNASCDDVRRAVVAHRNAQTRNFNLRPGARHVLEAIRLAGLRIGIVSDCTHEFRERWDGLGLDRYVETLALSIDLGVCKPDQTIYRHAMAALDLSPHECLYVGDGASFELTGATRVGMSAVQLLVPASEHHVSYRQDANWQGLVVLDLLEILDLLRIPRGGHSLQSL